MGVVRSQMLIWPTIHYGEILQKCWNSRWPSWSKAPVSGNSLEEKDVDGSKYNRAIVDNNTAQSLTSEDIGEMRRQGAKGDEIVEALIANSATFEKKTLFSQERYRVKKQKKYAPRVLLRRPFARRFMRVDALSLLLCLGNVTANADVLVVDMVGGILTGAIAERLGELCMHQNWTHGGIIKEVLPLLAFSAPFAVYHQYASPLATCMHSLQIEKMAIGLQISEPWLREYQVLAPPVENPSTYAHERF
ncbi:hypothetical protein CQW23_29410 [Capsicum baccatum]|uniref:tRNA (adenine(58)-N(1))-methyltransferase non-catalytic subunit TRM6 n=1 Tax=Capsicum baccatum TaxID=33114 RepID=A0A2G2VJC8_CAPBA|nr:hypothetical protein CQW23_29410 [Capsicum baccatum]